MRKVLLFVLFLSVATAGTVVHPVRFSPSELQFSTWNDFAVVELGRGHCTGEPGLPALPVVNIALVIPAAAVITGVTAEVSASVDIDGRFRVAPQQRPMPLSKPASGGFTGPNPDIYGSDNPWPPAILRNWDTGRASGFRLASVQVCPFRYCPESGRLALVTELSLRVSYDLAGAATVLTPAQAALGRSRLRDLVDNPDDLEHCSPATVPTDQTEVQYLVVTAERLATKLEPFAAYRRTRGLRTEVRTIEWVDRNYPGRDVQERLRNCIRDYFERRGLCYVLLAGDNAEVPSRRIRVNVFDEQGNIPTDLYYGDLDWSWDSNHNSVFGEMEDTVDLYADVFVGRASVQDSTQATTLLDKVQRYEQEPDTGYIRRALLPSGWLWQSIGYHGRFMNESIAGITPPGWLDRAMINPAGAGVVADSFERGFALFDPAGHGNSGGVYNENGTPIYTSGVAGQQHNDGRFAITTSLACDPGDFEAEDCLAEVSHNCPRGGSIAVMMNSRYGWGTPPSIGPSELLCIRFYDFLLRRSTWSLGAGHDRSREEYAASAQWSELWRWCMTEFNLFGDPALDIWTDRPAVLTLSAADTIPTGGQNISVSVLRNGSPVAGLVVCASDGRDLFALDTTDAAGSATLNVHPTRPGSLTIRTFGHNCRPASRTVTVIQGAPEPDIVLWRVAVDDAGAANPNGVLEPGESVRLTLVLRNAGTASASGVAVVVRPGSAGVTSPDSTAALGAIPAGDTSATSDLTITCGPQVRPGSNPELVARVTAGEGAWDVPFILGVGYPGRVSAEVDTGTCALTATARGSLGYDIETARAGRGFRYPKHDTSCLNIASFALGSSADRVVDRFYTDTDAFDRDWRLQDSVRQVLPLWNADEVLTASFSDAGHESPAGIFVLQRVLASADPDLDNFCVVVYDVWNNGTSPLQGTYAGLLADFDVKATDRLHDVATVLPGLGAAYMRNAGESHRVCGLKLLAPAATGHGTCIDHARYVYPDSGLSEDMKFRALQGTLGSQRADRPYNWSLAVSSGPFDLLSGGGRQRLAFAIIAAQDSAAFVTAALRSQEWYDTNVALTEPRVGGSVTTEPPFSIRPATFSRSTAIRCGVPQPTAALVTAFDATGRRVDVIHSGVVQPGQILRWSPHSLPAGTYVVSIKAGSRETALRAVVLR